MRYYKLRISNSSDLTLSKGDFSGFEWELSASNPIAPRIEFAIQSYAGLQGVTFIKLYNPPLSFVKNAKMLQGKFITLHAGLDKSPITNINKIQKPNNNLIFKGIIQTLQTAIEGTECMCSLFCNPDTPKSYESSFCINQNENIAQAFKAQFEAYYKHFGYSTIKVEIDKNAQSITNNNEQTMLFKPTQSESSNYISYLQKCLNSLDMGTYYNNSTQTLYIVGNKVENGNFGNIVEAEASEFIGQPKWETITQVSFLMHLNPKYRVSSTLRVPSNVVFSGAGVISSNVNVGLGGENLAICEAGNYEIVGVEHLGNSREVSPESWCSKVLAQKAIK